MNEERHITRIPGAPGFLLAALLAFVPHTLDAYKDAIGYTQLQDALGLSTPVGAGIGVSMIEAPDADNYAPDTGNDEFSGKTISLKSGASGVSNHATAVGRHFFGDTTSVAPGIEDIDVYEVNNWLGAGGLQIGTINDPLVELQRIQNHSWIGAFSSESDSINALRRFDYSINRDGFVAVVGLDNGSGADVPDLLGHSYNAIAVGRSDGGHSRDGSRFDEGGRLKPDLVAPLPNTSNATAVVSSAAALLLSEADSDDGLSDARDNPQVIKSILMAGATKEEFSSWLRTSEEPLDPVYGAGQLNVYNSHRILTAGHQEAGVDSFVGLSGWDFANTEVSSLTYFFEFQEALETFTANLAWNRQISDRLGLEPGPPQNDPSASDWALRDVIMGELHLSFSLSNGFQPGSQLQTSISEVDNMQHIFLTGVPAGEYVLTVHVISDISGGTDYGLAWDATPIPEPAAYAAILGGLVVILVLRRRARVS